VTFDPDGQNPYAPLAVSIDTRRPEAPLPEGVRRFRLDPPRYDKFQRIVLVQLLAVALMVFVPAFTVVAILAHTSATNTIAISVLTFGWIVIARLVRIRFARKANIDTYELLVSERTARRNLSGFVSAEFLRPELTKIFEVPTGLWLTSESPPHSLFIASAVDHYADAYATFSSWGKIEKLRGIAAWSFARKQARRQGARDLTMGTVLASDATLVQELTMLRSISTTAGLEQPRSRWAPVLRAAGIWFALVILFLAIWQFLTPSAPS
jgi:hypothetical protein